MITTSVTVGGFAAISDKLLSLGGDWARNDTAAPNFSCWNLRRALISSVSPGDGARHAPNQRERPGDRWPGHPFLSDADQCAGQPGGVRPDQRPGAERRRLRLRPGRRHLPLRYL